MSKTYKLTFVHLVDWVEGKLTEEEAAVVAAQVAIADEEIQATVAWLRAFNQVSSSIVLASPPQKVRELLRRRFEAHTQGRRQAGFLQRFIAALSFDSGLQSAVAGLRAVSAQASPRQIIYATDVAEIALNILPRPQDKHLDINGQIFTSGKTTLTTFGIQLLRGATEVGLTTSDDLGEFVFKAIPSGVYELVLSTDQMEILITPVELNV